ncbi:MULTISPECIES: helix-turn-helix domain-containing protein [Streptomyces]|uniref:DNA-binding protein n=1 Tax=Streptomyces qinglanensis TaxID=943816 RepID=A0A1E7K404_9ACTN|nr:helix-turn-helix transcriptional regulator [Streptomyces qinglanensis]OEU98651.1 DNA-binding protein [Streptomyces qinglanensis]OEV28786.1 DNA-binding protein [Streptomyces nanshensis]
MPEQTDSSETFGQRVRRARIRNGQTRAVVGGLVGRSTEWVKAIETGRLKCPRLPLLLHLADVLGVTDLAELTGDDRVTAAAHAKTAHEALPGVRAALTSYRLSGHDEEPESADELARRVSHAWHLWHAPGEHRTRVAVVLPDLLADAQHSARALDGVDRRRALVALAETYHLAQLFLSFQPAPELVMLTGDRSMAAAQDADSPRAMAAAAWYMNHVFRDAGERHEARVDLAMKAADLLRPEASRDELARWGLLHLAAALSYAKVGRRGDADRFWDRADEAARRLGPDYSHPYLIFGRGMVDAYAITMQNDLVRPGAAVEAAHAVEIEGTPSATRRAFHQIESARAYALQGETVAVVHLLKRAFETSPETVRYNLFAHSTLRETPDRGLVRDDVRYLRAKLRVSA